ncbi:MAG TPA: hypothetical protein VJH63_02975 [Candidatus Paceibacterota bacterium]
MMAKSHRNRLAVGFYICIGWNEDRPSIDILSPQYDFLSEGKWSRRDWGSKSLETIANEIANESGLVAKLHSHTSCRSVILYRLEAKAA